ncbi:MAG: tyrosine-type recombinase/integrase [Chloroflexota bacterium]
MREVKLPLSKRVIPLDTPLWLHESEFLFKAGENSLKTETTYRSGLRLFADWLQHFKRNGYSVNDNWPISADHLNNDVLIGYRQWLLNNRSSKTATTYMAAMMSYLSFLEDKNELPQSVHLSKLQRQLRKRRSGKNAAETVVDLDEARQDIPKIIAYYSELPLPAENDKYNRRLSILRDRALVWTIFSTAARISEIAALNRPQGKREIPQFLLVTGKGNKTRTVHIRDYAQGPINAYLKERRDHNPALFVSHSRNSQNARITITSIHNVVKKAVRSLDLHPKLSAHDFRHYRASSLLRDGMPLEVLQEFLGHEDITTTRNIYAPLMGVQVIHEWLDNMDRKPSLQLTEAPIS